MTEWFYLAALIIIPLSNLCSFYLGAKVVNKDMHIIEREPDYEIKEPHNYMRPEDGEYEE
ncbi:MAG: hypothetical protein GVX78_02130 [Bacteroidetes bacterium]|jgi:hypothetical protein|nr:hypothetical protein [Bacteroidota bacterium]